MLNNQQKKIVEILLKTDHATAEVLAYLLNVSEKTVRTRIKEINEKIDQFGLKINAKRQYGFYILKEQSEDFKYLISDYKDEQEFNPSTIQERVEFLTLYLLNANDYTKADDLCDMLFISKSTLTKALKNVREIYKQYGLELVSRPNFGLILKGNEESRRQAIVHIYNQNDSGIINLFPSETTQEINELGSKIYPIIERNMIQIPELSFNSLIEYLYFSAKRIKEGNKLDFKLNEQVRPEILKVSEEIVNAWSKHFGFDSTEDEINYISLFLSGSRVTEYNNNFVIHSELDKLVVDILELIYNDYHLDLRNNFDLKMFLNQHMVSMDIRLKYNINIANPLLENIKIEYPFAFTLAKSIAFILERKYKKFISDDELSYFAVLFELALSSKEEKLEKKSILIVNSPDGMNSKFLEYKYKTQLSDYISNIYIRTALCLNDFDYQKVDYVITTVPIHQKVPVPIVQVNPLLCPEDIKTFKKFLKEERKSFLDDFYSSKLFFTNLESNKKEEVLKELIERTGEEIELPKNFYDSVIEREQMSTTDYGGMLAIPHPNKILTDKTVVSVAILDKPVFWGRNEVRVVILTSVGKNEKRKMTDYYEATTSLLANKKDIETILKKKDFSTFMKILKKNSPPYYDL